MADDKQTDAEKAKAEAHAAEVKAQEARAKAETDDRTAAEKRADVAEQKADDARAKAAEASGGDPEGLKTVGEAGIVAPHVDPDTPAGDVMAVKRGNDPANPQPLPGIPADYNGPTTRLTRTSPDKPGEPITTDVHPDMVGDYLRAGWSLA